MSFRTAVIIPFFQRKAGILIGAVRSVLAQKANFEIIVVDDCSPIPATSELQDVLQDRIRIVKMDKNSGQGAARNKGLDSVQPDTEFVAFLDSDDEWSDNHLTNAIFALDRGFEFYFSDFYQLHQTVSAFRRAGRIDPAQHECLAGSDNVRVFQADMFNQIIKGNILGMSTMVYRFRKFPHLRFREDFRSTGEEYIFWLDLAQQTNRIAFSSAIECHYGQGVNTYSGATWGSEGAIQKLHDEIKYLRYILVHYGLDDHQKNHVLARIDGLRVDFVREVMHRITHRKGLDLQLCAGVFKFDPLLLLYGFPVFVKLLFDKLGLTGKPA